MLTKRGHVSCQIGHIHLTAGRTCMLAQIQWALLETFGGGRHDWFAFLCKVDRVLEGIANHLRIHLISHSLDVDQCGTTKP